MALPEIGSPEDASQHRPPLTRHFLAIGGTGMLAQATVALADAAARSTIVARHAHRFAIAHRLPPEVAVEADWTRPAEFSAVIGQEMIDCGPVDLALVWIHADGRESLQGLLPLLDAAPCRMVRVLGSVAREPRQVSSELHRALERYERIAPSIVILGSKLEGRRRRWLTHDEISAGVLHSVASGRDIVVGEVVPP